MKQHPSGRCCILVAVTALFCLCSTALAGDPAVILNKGITDTDLSKEEVKNIYLGNKTKWSDNSTIIVTVLSEGATHRAFIKTVVGRSPSQFQMTWKKLKFTGKGKMPKEVDSEAEMLDFVSKNKGAIGYLDPGSGTDGVTAVAIN